MFNYPATEVYNPSGGYRVVWSAEEWEQALREGWLTEKPAVPVFAPTIEDLVEIRKTKRGKAVVPSTEPEAA